MKIFNSTQDAYEFAKTASVEEIQKIRNQRKSFLDSASFIMAQAQFCRECEEKRLEIETKLIKTQTTIN